MKVRVCGTQFQQLVCIDQTSLFIFYFMYSVLGTVAKQVMMVWAMGTCCQKKILMGEEMYGI